MDKDVRIFLSYAQEDTPSAKEIEKYLSFLKKRGSVTVWDTASILPGQKWRQTILEQLKNAQIILLLISPNFLASPQQYEELGWAMERNKKDQVHVIPIILRPVDISSTPLTNLTMLPKNGKPVSRWQNRELAYLDIIEAIDRIIVQLDNSSNKARFKSMGQL